MNIPRAPLLAVGLLALALGLLAACTKPDAASSTVRITVYKSPTCGCCGKWIDHLKQHGFAVETMNMPDVATMKTRFGVPTPLTSCHTAVVGGYVVEGHVPADVIQRLLAERPDVTGIAVAGMPIGSPGMETPGRAPQPYEVIAFDRRGGQEVYATR